VVSGSTVVDISGNGLNGTLNGDAVYSSTDRALTFDGVDDYVSGTLNNPAGAWVHSTSFWYRQDSVVTATWDYVYHIGAAASEQASLFAFKSDGYLVMANYSSASVRRAFVPTLGQWYHISVVYSGGGVNVDNVSIYLDGKDIELFNDGDASSAVNLSANANFRIGSIISNGNYAHGSISNFKLWNVALTAEEVAAEYALGRTGKALNVTDTALCLGGTVPRAQLDVRGSALVGGNLGVGTATPAYTLDVLGNIYASGNIIMYSDARLKENIRVIENALDKVCSLNGYTFTKRGETVHNTGVLAQEVLRVLPEVVHGSEETNYSVAYGNMVGILIEAIKELRAKNDALQAIVSEICKK